MNYRKRAAQTVLQHTEQGDWLRTLASYVQMAIEYDQDGNATEEERQDWLRLICEMIVLTDHWFELRERAGNDHNVEQDRSL